MATVDKPDFTSTGAAGASLIADALTEVVLAGNSFVFDLGNVSNFAQMSFKMSESANGNCLWTVQFWSDAAHLIPITNGLQVFKANSFVPSGVTLAAVGPYCTVRFDNTGAVAQTATLSAWGTLTAGDPNSIFGTTLQLGNFFNVAAGGTTNEGPFGVLTNHGVMSGYCQLQPWQIDLLLVGGGGDGELAVIGGLAGQSASMPVLLPPGEVTVSLHNHGSGAGNIIVALVDG